ncbi:hypothetical protein [Parasitella parasitica]|uniref:Reverse transcriptase domain-containing protein n=1 Tax=Parasitella parasitica TaxID=35722 RepID=A0A0B7N2X5_9FUNG|nr:hypothetical protein [Parasitella parasitica]
MEDAQQKWAMAEQRGNDPQLRTLNADIGLLLDQEKAYDRGDPLSPILYNLAFELFLLSIIHDRHFSEYVMGQEQTKILCYADDALVFVHNASDLGLQAFSVSGRYTWESWETVLTPMNIMHLHSVKDEDPLIYLGFPLVQSRLRRVNFGGTLITKLKVANMVCITSYSSHSGRFPAVEVNCHSVFEEEHLPGYTVEDMDSSQSTGWPRSSGYQLQASALYYRWLHPLLGQDQEKIDARPVFYLLSFHIRNLSNCHYHQIPLLFPCSRSQGLKKQRVVTLDMLYSAVDLLPRSFAQTQINTATAMVLPLQASFFVPPTSAMVAPLRNKQMLVSDVFQYDSNLNFLHWKDTRDPSLLQWSRTPSTMFKGLARELFQLQPYFVPVCRPAPLEYLEVSFAPFVNQLISTDGRSSVSAKSFRLAVLCSVIPPSTLRNISTAHWQMFWSLSLIPYSEMWFIGLLLVVSRTVAFYIT